MFRKPTSAITASTTSRITGADRKLASIDRSRNSSAAPAFESSSAWSKAADCCRTHARAFSNSCGFVPWKPKIACLKSPTMKMVRPRPSAALAPAKNSAARACTISHCCLLVSWLSSTRM
jgi:hypothetical protein